VCRCGVSWSTMSIPAFSARHSPVWRARIAFARQMPDGLGRPVSTRRAMATTPATTRPVGYCATGGPTQVRGQPGQQQVREVVGVHVRSSLARAASARDVATAHNADPITRTGRRGLRHVHQVEIGVQELVRRRPGRRPVDHPAAHRARAAVVPDANACCSARSRASSSATPTPPCHRTGGTGCPCPRRPRAAIWSMDTRRPRARRTAERSLRGSWPGCAPHPNVPYAAWPQLPRSRW